MALKAQIQAVTVAQAVKYLSLIHILRVYHLPLNQGEPAVMQFAMDMLNYMNVEYVARMDADDICVPHRFEKQVQYLDAVSYTHLDVYKRQAA